jgi:hypothetical protein
MLMGLFGKKITDDQLDTMKRVYFEALENMSTEAITGGFKRAEQTLDRFPTPRAMRDLCADCETGGLERYDYGDSRAIDPGTGQEVAVKIDPITREILYKAEDCPEGREFLATLRRIAGPKRAKA